MLKNINLKALPGELQNKWERLGVYAYFPLQCFMYFTKVIGHSVNLFVGIPSNLLFIFLSIKRFFQTLLDKKKNSGDFFIIFFLLTALLSGALTLIEGFPPVCYTTSLKIFILPILFYFWGRDCRDTSVLFYKIFVFTCFIVMMIGLYLYFTMPSFYSNYLYESYQNAWMKQGSEATEDMVIDHSRFRSFLSSSYSVCFFAVSSLVIVFNFFLRKRADAKFIKSDYNTILLNFMAIVFLISSILCLQRIAMVCSVAIVVFYFCYGAKYKNNKLIKFLFLLIIAAFAFLTFHISNERDAQILENLVVRLGRLNMEDAMGARTDQYKFIEDNIGEYLIGTGLGSAGNKAAELGFNGVTDGEYFRMYAEQGILGILVFFLIAISSLVRGMKNFKVYNLEVIIIFFFLLACIGANALSINLWAGIFWYAIGRIWNKQYLQRELLTVR